ncbi:hypothetical protein TWF569_004724 [Orbilia oligospora]|uniref:Mannose-P-dolichol utilization defect 1 protein homolog n=1 Tax=Orbilia oligospora TaxID=2813651 RepID=A0A4Z0X6E2_ORBOL|nr:hypothetical protein TWF706_001602 [Orbilia oligospora]KAF3089917.1 hypothetical protein TWF103_000640 [Orbilia oligospora]KAF3105432.1 hypothetical protein TWF102_002348 [Orbilia oligospora]KAF3122645.1 hypothetical protein TWF703_001155 [Orbilia oligospora]KAF3128759.1 hypothetical protein TWF594_011508 [Orbilia oligospora]
MDTIRPLLQPITTSLPAPIKDLGISLIGSHCYTSLIENIDISDTACIKLGVSKGLGIGIIAASSIVKIPQILKIINSNSASGLSLLSTLLETGAYAISIAYNFRNGFPFSTFGETALIVVQNLVIAVLILHFTGKGGYAGVLIAGFAAAAYALLGGDVVSEKAMTVLQASTIPISLASKVPQIYTVWKEGGTGQLSAFAVFNFLAGSLARVFTTLQEVDDPLILWGYLGGAILNAVLTAQMVYYWDSSSSSKSKKRTKKSLKAIPDTKTPETPARTRSKGEAEVSMETAVLTDGGSKAYAPGSGKGSLRKKSRKA